MVNKRYMDEIIEACRRVSSEENNWGFISVQEDYEKIVEHIEKAIAGKGDKKLTDKILSFLGRTPSIKSRDNLIEVLDEYIGGDNRLKLEKYDAIGAYLFKSVLQDKSKTLKDIGIDKDEVPLMLSGEFAEKLGLDGDRAKIVFNVLSKSGIDALSGMTIINNRELLDNIHEISFENVAFMDDFTEMVKRKYNIEQSASKSLYERNKNKILSSVHIYTGTEIEKILESVQNKTYDGLFTVDAAENLTQPLIDLMIAKEYILKVNKDRGVYLPIYRNDTLRGKSLDKFSKSFLESIKLTIKKDFERRNYVMHADTLRNIITGHVAGEYNIDRHDIKDKVIDKVFNLIVTDIRLRDAEYPSMLRMKKEFEDKIQTVQNEIANEVVNGVVVATSIKDLKSEINKKIENKVNDIWEVNYSSYIKEYISTDTIYEVCEELFNNKGYASRTDYIVSSDINDIIEKVKKEIYDKIDKTAKDVNKIISRSESVLDDIINKQYNNLDNNSKSALKDIVLTEIKKDFGVI